MRYAMFWAIFLLCVSVLSTQAAGPEIDRAKEADIRRLVAVLAGDDTVAGLIEQVLKFSAEPLRQDLEKNIPPKRVSKIMEAIRQELAPRLSAQFEDIAIPVYDKHFTHAEIKKLIQFYESPVGQRSVEVMPQMAGEIMAATSQRAPETTRQTFIAVEKRFPEFRIVLHGPSEDSAVASLRVINSGCKVYQSNYPERGFPASLVHLGPPTTGTETGPDAADLLSAVLASGTKNRYRYEYVASDTDDDGALDAYEASARPVDYGWKGRRSFFANESGVIRSTEEDRPATADDRPFVEPLGVATEELSPEEQEFRQRRKRELRNRVRQLEAQLGVVWVAGLDSLEELKRKVAETNDPEQQEELKIRLRERKELLSGLAMSLANAYYQLGELDKATETIRKAISIDPENRQYREQLEKFEEARKVNR